MADNISISGAIVRTVDTAGAEQQVVRTGPHRKTARGYEKITVAGTAVALTPVASATHALVRVETADIMYRDDGTAPTAADGMFLLAGEAVDVAITTLANFKMIRKSATSATAYVLYYSYD